MPTQHYSYISRIKHSYLINYTMFLEWESSHFIMVILLQMAKEDIYGGIKCEIAVVERSFAE